jgi:alginate O-acetyltransferase complex protein AlgI
MIFSSIEFLIFFFIFLVSIFILKNFQRLIIICFSLFFYAYWNINFIFLIIFNCCITYYLIKKNFSLWVSITILILPLIYFKYSFFFINLLDINILHPFIYSGELPLAISFITFTAIAALVDRKNKNNNDIDIKNFSEYLLYFPQLIAGPILRLQELLPQLQKKITISKESIKLGILLFCVGYVKKVYFADNISIMIDPLFENPGSVNVNDLIKGFLLFPIQIYFDFSGYVDMALGISIILGIKLPVNFNKPYHTSSLTEFWRCWHITLSTWFRDYIYIRLGGSKKNKLFTNINLIITMCIAGLWHGASLNFLLWGFLNGFLLSIEKILNLHRLRNNLFRCFINCFIIFNLWIVFRINDFSIMYNYFTLLYSNIFSIIKIDNLFILIFVILMIYSQKIDNFYKLKDLSSKIRLSFLIPFVIIILTVGFSISLGQSQKFIYFQF